MSEPNLKTIGQLTEAERLHLIWLSKTNACNFELTTQSLLDMDTPWLDWTGRTDPLHIIMERHFTANQGRYLYVRIKEPRGTD